MKRKGSVIGRILGVRGPGDDTRKQGAETSLFRKVIEVLDSMDNRYDAIPGEPSIIQFVQESNSGELDHRVSFLISEAQSLIMSHVSIPFIIPEETRLAVAEFVVRANFGSQFETIEVDLDTGAFHVRTSMIMDGGELSGDMVKHMLFGPMNWLEKHLPGIVGIAVGSLSPAEAYASR